jgi:branched-chain amino acid transport system permease protein
LLKNFSLKSLFACLVLLVILLILPPILPRFYTYILASIFVTALLAMSLNMVVGHGGLFQFHHGAFYGVGAYAFALLLYKAHMPVWFGFIAAPVIAAFAGLLIGWFCVRSTSLYFGMLQISLGSLLWAIVFRWYSLTNGDDGIHGVPIPSSISSSSNAYYFILFFFVLCLVVMYLIHRSPFGMTLQAIRDNPARCSAVGINVRRHQLMAIVIATFFAGVAGVLFVVLGFSGLALLGPFARNFHHVPFRRMVHFCRAYPWGGDHRGSKNLCRNIHRLLDLDSWSAPDPPHLFPAGRGDGLLCPEVRKARGRRGCAGKGTAC